MNHRQYTRKGKYSIEEVHKHIELTTSKFKIIYFDGDPIKIGSGRYKTFKFKGIKCVCCDLVGAFYAKEKEKIRYGKLNEMEIYHFNLYAIDKNGEEILMTKDHIVPKSKGGKNHIDNYQPMCTKHNQKKKDLMISPSEVRCV